MGIFDLLIEYYSIPDAIDYLSSNLGEEVTEQDLSRLITERKLRVWIKLKTNILARVADCSIPIGDDYPLPLHPDLYYCESINEIEQLDVYTVRASRVLELGMTHTDMVAIEDKIRNYKYGSAGNLTYPITLVDPEQTMIFYLCEKTYYGWGGTEDWNYTNVTELPHFSELLIKFDELKRLVNNIQFLATDLDDLFIEPPQAQPSSPIENSAPAFQSLSAPPPKQMPSEVTASKVSAALIRLLSESSSGRYAHKDGGAKLKTIAEDLIKNERKNRDPKDANPRGFSDSTLHNIKKADEHYHDISLESALLDYLTRISDPDK